MCHSTAISNNGDPSPATLSVDLLQNGEKKESINLDEFEKKQKLIEEQNRLKKEILGKALALRYTPVIIKLTPSENDWNANFRKKKTEDEAQKLQQITVELTKLDASLSNDVSILRSHIEVASVELTDAK